MRRFVRGQKHVGLCVRARGWTYVSDDGYVPGARADDRYAIGDPSQHPVPARCAAICFLNSPIVCPAVGLTARSLSRSRTRDLIVATAAGCAMDHVVFLDRASTRCRPVCAAIPKSLACGTNGRRYAVLRHRRRFVSAQRHCHERLLGARLWENAVFTSRRRSRTSGTIGRSGGLIRHEPPIPRHCWYSLCSRFRAFSQVSSGSLLGDARDEKAASVEAAFIVAARTTTRIFTRSVSTNDFGSYRIDDLLPGAYTVTAQHDGFQAVTVSPIFVEVNQKTAPGFRSARWLGA